MNTIHASLISTLIATLSSGAAYAQCQNLDSGNQNPFAAIHLQTATLNHSQCEDSISLRYSVSNNFVLESSANENLEIDGEVSRFELRLHNKLDASHWLDGISLNLPLYNHSAGFMDDIIDDWHDFTGLPAGKRNQRANDQIKYNYVRNGQTLVNITNEQQGLGDITLAAHKGNYNLALKLPTGDEKKLTGSGGLEVAASYQQAIPNAGSSGVASGIGINLINDDKVLTAQSRSATGTLALFAAYGLAQRTNLFISGNWQTASYDSEIDALGGASGNIGFGFYGVTNNGSWSLRLTEDLPTETAPDFGISFDYSIAL